MNKFFAIATAFLGLTSSIQSQTKYDTIVNYITKTPINIDAQSDEECWANAQWNSIDQVWMPFGATMNTGDFDGKFKVAWDDLYLYLLVEVIDDSLSDDHSNPLENWWDDDCLEIFIDENRSMGNHECTNNAFAYHVSLFYDAIDLSTSCGGINYKDHVMVKMDTIAEDTYRWEMAFKLYDASYSNSNAEASRVTLTPNKLMGITVAYCDNDETTGRENFIGSMKMTASTNNEMYKNASYFGPMKLIDPDYVGINEGENNELKKFIVYPNPANSQITLNISSANNNVNLYSISSITGQQLKSGSFMGSTHTLFIEELSQGIYILKVTLDEKSYSNLIIKE